VGALGAIAPFGCGPGKDDSGSAEGGGGSTSSDGAVVDARGAADVRAAASDGGVDGTVDGAGGSDGHIAAIEGGVPSGWLYTKGNQVYVSEGAGAGTVWTGRGVNMDDLFLCGYDNNLQMQSGSPTAEQTLESLVAVLGRDWKPTFVRISLSMNSYRPVSWLTDPSQYRTPMTNVIRALGALPNLYVLVTLRTDASMVGQDPGNPEATNVPSSAGDSPDAAAFPTGTDAVYAALVDTFADSNFVVFRLSNEPGGNQSDQTSIVSAMTHAVGVIRAEEDKLDVPHHLVSVQGTGYTGDVAFYSTTPLAFDNVVYEVHGYPPSANSYTFSNIPVILGEYGDLDDSTSFYADLESKHIPNLAWDLEPFSNCAPDLVNVNYDASALSLTSWGDTVKAYLNAHAP
jgi:hypothetical protein